MTRSFRPAFVLLFSLVAASLAGCNLMSSEAVPDVSNYPLDEMELRALALSLPGPRPAEVRIAKIGSAGLPGAIMMAGKSWDTVSMDHVAFQLVRPDGSFILIDTTQSREMHEGTPGSEPFDETAWDQIVRAAEEAEQIIITHEHPDHLGGAARHPRPEKIAGNLRLSDAQLANRDALDAIDFPKALEVEGNALSFEDMIAIAPGVVVKKAAGHTPGSQMIYVLLGNDSQLLFVGDVIWNLDAMTELRYRPRLMTDWIIGENREQAIHQLRALRDLDDRGGVHIVVAHDRRTHDHPNFEMGFRFQANP